MGPWARARGTRAGLVPPRAARGARFFGRRGEVHELCQSVVAAGVLRRCQRTVRRGGRPKTAKSAACTLPKINRLWGAHTNCSSSDGHQ